MTNQFTKIATTVCFLLVTAGSIGVAEQTDSFSFLLSGVQNKRVSFKGGEGCAWKDLSYECSACSFLVHQAGVSGQTREDAAGLLVNFRDSSSELALTCQARECTLTSILSSGKTESQKLIPHQTGVVAASAHVSITVAN